MVAFRVMVFTRRVCIVLGTVFAVISAQETVNISGTVIDNYGGKVQGATVRIRGSALSGATNTQGQFHLSGAMTPVRTPQDVKNNSVPYFVGNDLFFTVSDAKQFVAVSIFNVKGQNSDKVFRLCGTRQPQYRPPSAQRPLRIRPLLCPDTGEWPCRISERLHYRKRLCLDRYFQPWDRRSRRRNGQGGIRLRCRRRP